jgi:hypothetical protein
MSLYLNIPEKGKRDQLLDWAGDPVGVSSSFISLDSTGLIAYLNKPTLFESCFDTGRGARSLNSS